MNYKKVFSYFIVFNIVIFSTIIGVNYYFDFYAVFKQNQEVYYDGINDRYAKVAYILNNKDKYNTFLWGSSRSQKMNPLILDIKSYNMAAPAGMPEDCLQNLKIFINNGIKVKNVYLGVDNFSYKMNYLEKINNTIYTPYSENKLSNIKYLIKVAVKNPDIDKIKISIGLSDSKRYKSVEDYIITTGQIKLAKYIDDDIEKSINKYVFDDKFNKPFYEDDKNEHIDSTISTIKEIKQICDANDINLVVFFNPVHITSYLKDDIEISNRFKKGLANITDFYDFNYINFITVNNYFWYETSHPRYFVCDWQLKVITNQYDEKIPKDFGHLVTKKNVDYYCNKYKIDKENFKMPEKQYIPEYPII